MMTLLSLIIAGVVVIVLAAALMVTSRPRTARQADPTTPLHLSAQTQADLAAELERTYRTQIHDSTAVFAKDLMDTSQRLSAQVERLTTEVITRELDQYSQTLTAVRQIAASAAEQIKKATAEQQAELRKALEATIAVEQEQRLAQIDAHLSEIITSYLAEALGTGADLGAQADYIVKSLEAHKDQIKQDLGNDR